MNSLPGSDKPKLHELPRIKERLTFLYIERCVVNRQDGAITVTDIRGTVCVPAAVLGVLMLGPGTNVSHRAMELLGDSGACAIWVGEHGVRYYAHGRPLTESSRLIEKQAELVSNTRKRLAVARIMYQMRFPNEDVSGLTMQQLRGREGSRIRSVYRKASKETGVEWTGREYKADEYDKSTPINKALSAAHACLYGVVQSVIVALGCSPALGFVHKGHERAFVYDIADLYKADITIPLAFVVTSENPSDIGKEIRHRVRDVFAESHILERITYDIRFLLLESDSEDRFDVDTLRLWDDKGSDVKYGISYGKETHKLPDESDCEGYGTLLKKQT